MRLKIGFSWCRVEESSETEDRFLKNFLGFTVKGRFGVSKSESLYFPKSKIFPAGLASLVVRSARNQGYSVEVSNRMPLVPLPTSEFYTSSLWPHQRDGILKALEQKRGILQHATGCLSGDTTIEINRAGESFKIKLKDLVHRFNGGVAGNRRWELHIQTMVRYRTNDGYIRLAKLRSAYASGVKTTYTVTTESGRSIRATKDHLFLTKFGWKPLADLRDGQEIWTASGPPKKTGRVAKKPQYCIVGGLRRHPYAGRKHTKRGNLASVSQHRLVMEAALNKIPYEAFVEDLRKRTTESAPYTFLDPKVFAVHHIDENPKNNELENLIVLAHTEHHKQHGVRGGWKKVTETTTVEKITSIVKHGEEETFDLEMESDPHNFMANGFVVHNSGKGSLISYLCKILPGRVLVVVTSKQLLHEMYDRIKLWAGEAPGRVGGGFKELGKRVVVCVQASLKTLPKRLLEAFAAIIGDEVHSAASDSYMKPLMQCTNAGIRIGLSGTPLEREDKRHLHIVGLFGEIIHRYTPKQAADDKITARATLKIVKSKVPIFYAEKYAELGNYPEWDKWAIANNRTRNLKIVDLISRTDIPFPKIVFVRTIYHQEVLKSQYGLGECPSLRYVNHKTPSEEIQEIKAGIEDGTVKVLISGPIFRQGVDMKRIATIINAAGGKATVDVIQKAGRGSRRLQDDGSHKENFLMIDFEDRGCDTPCPHKTCEWLRRHSKLRQTAYKKFGYTPQEFQ